MAKRFDFADVLVFVGLSCLGAGLYLLYGLEIALVSVGGILLCIGLYSAGFAVRKPKGR